MATRKTVKRVRVDLFPGDDAGLLAAEQRAHDLEETMDVTILTVSATVLWQNHLPGLTTSGERVQLGEEVRLVIATLEQD